MRWTLLLVFVFAVGCNGAGIVVQGPGAGGTQSSSSSGSPLSGPAIVPAAGASSATHERLVYFERVLVDESAAGNPIDELAAVEFASTGTQTTTPLGIALKNAADFASQPILFETGGGVAFLQSNGLMSNSLVTADMSTLATRSLYDFPVPVAQVAANAAGSAVAFIDVNGGVSVATLPSGEPRALSLPSPATRVRLSSDGSRLFAQGADGVLRVYQHTGTDAQDGSWSEQSETPRAVSAVFSPDGSRIAVVRDDGQVLLISDAGSGAPIATLESVAIHDLTWVKGQKGGEFLSYWAKLASGAREIRVVPTGSSGKGPAAAPAERTVARISVPDSIGDGVVCPAWDSTGSGDLYFADFTQSEFRVERAKLGSDGAASAAVSFAIPIDASEGFICPMVAEGASR